MHVRSYIWCTSGRSYIRCMCVRYRKWLLLLVSGGMDRCYKHLINHWSYNYTAILLKDAGSCARLSSWHIRPAHVLSETHFKYPCLIHRVNNAVVVWRYSTPGSYYHIWGIREAPFKWVRKAFFYLFGWSQCMRNVLGSVMKAFCKCMGWLYGIFSLIIIYFKLISVQLHSGAVN